MGSAAQREWAVYGSEDGAQRPLGGGGLAGLRSPVLLCLLVPAAARGEDGVRQPARLGPSLCRCPECGRISPAFPADWGQFPLPGFHFGNDQGNPSAESGALCLRGLLSAVANPLLPNRPATSPASGGLRGPGGALVMVTNWEEWVLVYHGLAGLGHLSEKGRLQEVAGCEQEQGRPA